MQRPISDQIINKPAYLIMIKKIAPIAAEDLKQVTILHENVAKTIPATLQKSRHADFPLTLFPT